MNQATKESASAELLPCPFCAGAPKGPVQDGGSDERYGYNFTMTISCAGCGMRISAGSSSGKGGWCNDTGQAAADVIAAWNRRTPRAESADYAELRRLAVGATPGPWWAEEEYADNGEYGGLNVVSPVAIIINGENAPKDADAAFIAAANPETVLAMIDCIEELEGKK